MSSPTNNKSNHERKPRIKWVRIEEVALAKLLLEDNQQDLVKVLQLKHPITWVFRLTPEVATTIHLFEHTEQVKAKRLLNKQLKGL
jgi:hypothetical protein